MSVKAYNYVHKLSAAPNGEPITPTEKLVLFDLAWHHNAKTERCDPSLATLAKRTGLGRSTVQKAVTSLKRKGVLAIEHRKRKHSKSPSSSNYGFLALDTYTPSEARGDLRARSG